MKNEFFDVEEKDFMAELNLWIRKTGKYPLELITFAETETGRKVIAIPSYVDSDTLLFLGDKTYSNYQQALSRVGSIFDEMDIKQSLQDHIDAHPLSNPQQNA